MFSYVLVQYKNRYDFEIFFFNFPKVDIYKNTIFNITNYPNFKTFQKQLAHVVLYVVRCCNINLLKFKTVLLFIILVTWIYLHTSPLKNATYELFIFWSLSSNLPRLLSCQTQAMRTLHCVGNVTVTQLPSFLPLARTRPYSPATHLTTHLNHLNHPNHLPPLTCLLIWPTIISRAAENCVRAYSLDDSTTSDTVVAAALFIWLMTGLCSLSVLFYFIFFFQHFSD